MPKLANLNKPTATLYRDSLASVQLVAELQTVFHVTFNLNEVEIPRSDEHIRGALCKKGIFLYQRIPE